MQQYDEEYWDDRAVKPNWYHHILNHEVTENTFWERTDGLGRLDFSLLNKDNTVFLDLGCGYGRVAKKIAPLVKEYYGVDFSLQMIEKAKTFFRDYKNVHFIKNNGVDLKMFEDNSIDVTFACLIFFHIQKETIERYFKEVQRILKPGGIFYALNLPKNKIYVSPLLEKDIDSLASPFEIVQKRDEITHYFTLILKKK